MMPHAAPTIDTPAIAALFAEELARTIATPELQACRDDFNAFVEYAFRDEKGQPVKQAAHHRVMDALIQRHDRLVMWYPVEHGKTTQAVWRLVWLLGNHPDRQYAYVSSKATQAFKVVGAVKREIQHNPRVREVFPWLQPMRMVGSAAMEQWGTTAIRVEGCPPGTKDPSLAGYGLDGEIIGSRVHGVIMDNVLDRKNTASDTLRKKTVELIDNEVLTRVLPGGFALLLDTAWHRQDAMHIISARPDWASKKFSAAKPLRPGDATLWPDQWPKARLEKRRREVGTIAFDRQMLNRPLSDSLGFFKDQYIATSLRTKWRDRYTGKNQIVTGVDLAATEEGDSDLTAMVTCERTKAGMRVLNIRTGQWGAIKIVKNLLDIYELFHRNAVKAGAPSVHFRVETNAAQKYIKQLLTNAEVLEALGASEHALRNIMVEGHQTTSVKRDLVYGIPGVAADFEMGRLQLPTIGRNGTALVPAEVEALIEECKSWTPDLKHHTGDRLMALWIARTGMDVTAPTVDLV